MEMTRIKGDCPQEATTFCYRCQMDESQFGEFLPYVVEIVKVKLDIAEDMCEEFFIIRTNKPEKLIVEKILKGQNIDYKLVKH